MTAANAFDLRTWREATALVSFGMELCIHQGAVTVSLRHITPDGAERENCRIERPEPGSAFSPPVFPADIDGLLLPVVETASDDARFDLYFGTNDAPPLPWAKTAFVLEERAPGLAAAATVFGQFLEEHARHGAKEAAHLVLVDSAGDGQQPQGPGITLIPNQDTGLPGTGRGIYEACYGLLAEEGFTHLCLLRGGRQPDAEMFARAAAFMRFMRPGVHVCAPPADLAAEAAEALAASTMAADRSGPARWDWCCLDTRDIHRNGLPCPFRGSAAEREYGARLHGAGLRLAVPLSFRPGQAPASLPMSYAEDLALRALDGGLAQPGLAKTEFAGLVDDHLAAGNAEAARNLMNEMDRFLAGPEQLLSAAPRPASAPLRPPFRAWRLARRLRGQLRRIETGLPALIRRYDAARAQLSTIPHWSQTIGGRSRSAAATPDRAADTLQRHRELAALHLKADNHHRSSQAAWAREFNHLENRLEHNRLLDTARVHADQDRASRIMLSLLRDRHKGERAVIVGNGPSLRISDLDRLCDTVTFASNKIYLAYEDTNWRPSYYSVEDHLVIQNNWNRIAELEGSLKIFPANVRDFGFHAADTIFAPFRPPRSFDDPLSDPEFPEFSEDLSQGICWGSSVVYSQIQMALFMGCSEIILIGLDHSYTLPSVKKGNTYLHEGEQNHFHPSYREIGEKWHQPNLEVLEVSYARARERCAARGARILNASRQTRLEVFERADFDTLFPADAPRKAMA